MSSRAPCTTSAAQRAGLSQPLPHAAAQAPPWSKTMAAAPLAHGRLVLRFCPTSRQRTGSPEFATRGSRLCCSGLLSSRRMRVSVLFQIQSTGTSAIRPKTSRRPSMRATSTPSSPGRAEPWQRRRAAPTTATSRFGPATQVAFLPYREGLGCLSRTATTTSTPAHFPTSTSGRSRGHPRRLRYFTTRRPSYGPPTTPGAWVAFTLVTCLISTIRIPPSPV